MANDKSVKARKLKKAQTYPEQYAQFFTPAPSKLWQSDDVNFSLEQPHLFEVVPSQTVYISPVFVNH